MKLRRLYCTVDEFLYVAFDWQWADQRRSWLLTCRLLVTRNPNSRLHPLSITQYQLLIVVLNLFICMCISVWISHFYGDGTIAAIPTSRGFPAELGSCHCRPLTDCKIYAVVRCVWGLSIEGSLRATHGYDMLGSQSKDCLISTTSNGYCMRTFSTRILTVQLSLFRILRKKLLIFSAK